MAPIFTDGLRLEPENRGVTDYAASFGESLGATVSETLADSPVAQLGFLSQLEAAKGNDLSRISGDNGAAFGLDAAPLAAPPPATIDRLEAESRIKAAGLSADVKLDQDAIAVPALDLIINHAKERKERETTIARGPQGFFAGGAQLGTSFLVGAMDPLNLALAFIPVVGELRYGKLLAGAGETIMRRSAVRAGVGATEGVVGQAVLEPLNWYAHTQEGRDFGSVDVLRDLVFGAALGGVLHPAGGAIGDVVRRRQGRALYPFGPGEPMAHIDGTVVPERVLAEEGLPHDELPEHLRPVIATIDDVLAASPAMRILRDLPPRAHEDSMRAAIASLVDGEPVKVGEMLDAAASGDPRIAESFEAWHGSPHEFDRFDISKLGTGEGAQTFGHGLYFAENEKVAYRYKQTVSDKAFVNKVAQLYDDGFSPDDAWEEIKDHWAEFSPGEQRLMVALEKDAWLGFDYPHQAVNAALRDIRAYDVSPETADAVKALGHMYRVKIAGHADRFLDWDKPLAEQSEHVKAALAKLGIDVTPQRSAAQLADDGLLDATFVGRTGSVAYDELAEQLKTMKKSAPDANGFYRFDDGRQSASAALSKAGVHGIRYLDQGSRSAGEGTRNFVVFDDKHIEIVDRNGQPVAKPFTESAPGNPKITLGEGAGGQNAASAAGLARSFLSMNKGDVTAALREFDDYLASRPNPDSQFARDVRAAITAGDPSKVKAAAQTPRSRGRAAADPATHSLVEHLVSKGGLRADPELEAIYGGKRGPFVSGFGPLIRKNGMSLDDALTSAKEGGYLFDPHDADNGTAGVAGRTSMGLTPRDLLDALDAENRGNKLYKAGHLEATKFDADQEAHVVLGHIEAEFEAAGLKLSDIDPALLKRTTEIVHREGERDVLAAYERAIIEDEERYSAIAAARDTADAHPVRDVPFDASPASGRGGEDPGARGAAGRAGPGDRRADGAQSPGNGPGDRSAPEDLYRSLATRRADADDAELLAASREADRLPEVPTRLDERVAAADKAEAFARDMYKMFADRVPEGERQKLDDFIKALDEEHGARAEAIERGGACLFGARA